jgi:hypothetical protein
VADQRLSDDRAHLGLVVLQVGADRGRPVDIGQARPAVASGAIQRSEHRAMQVGGQPALDLLDHLADDYASGLPCPFRQRTAQREQHADQVDVRFDGLEQLGLDQHPPQAQPLQRVLLQNPDQRGGKVGSDIAEPAGHRGSRGAQPRITVLADRRSGVVDSRQRAVQASVPGTQPVVGGRPGCARARG